VVEQEQLVLKTLVSNYLDDDGDGEEGEMVITISKVGHCDLHTFWFSFLSWVYIAVLAGDKYVKN